MFPLQEVGSVACILVTGCAHTTVAHIVRGTFTVNGQNHARPTYKKDTKVNGLDVQPPGEWIRRAGRCAQHASVQQRRKERPAIRSFERPEAHDRESFVRTRICLKLEATSTVNTVLGSFRGSTTGMAAMIRHFAAGGLVLRPVTLPLFFLSIDHPRKTNRST